ncbi:hypothetical protein BASA61_002898, partial [Batrachochytrium salamandrivorans]
DESQVPEPTKDDPKCGPIVEKLTDVRRETYTIENEFRTQLPDHFNLMKGMYPKGEKINPRILKAEQVSAYRALSNEKKAKVRGFKKAYAGVMKKYRKIWKDFTKTRCFTESLNLFSPGEVTKRGPFP